MKKITAFVVACALAITAAGMLGCNKDTDTPGTSGATTYATALDVLNAGWDIWEEAWQFPVAGGSQGTMGAPDTFIISSDKDTFRNWTLCTDDMMAAFDDKAATMIHMMNTNTFTCAAVKMLDPSQASALAGAWVDTLSGMQWVCGHPDKAIVLTDGTYLVLCYGLNMDQDTLVDYAKSVFATELGLQVLAERNL